MRLSGMTHATVLITYHGESNIEQVAFRVYSKIFDNAATAKPYFLALTKCHFLLHSNDFFQV
jgi:hypothetical protein